MREREVISMIRTSPETARRVQRVARTEFGGISADETIQRLLDEHWKASAVAAVQRDRESDPDWQTYLDDADVTSHADTEAADGWTP